MLKRMRLPLFDDENHVKSNVCHRLKYYFSKRKMLLYLLFWIFRLVSTLNDLSVPALLTRRRNDKDTWCKFLFDNDIKDDYISGHFLLSLIVTLSVSILSSKKNNSRSSSSSSSSDGNVGRLLSLLLFLLVLLLVVSDGSDAGVVV